MRRNTSTRGFVSPLARTRQFRRRNWRHWLIEVRNMHITVSGKQIDLSDALQERVASQLDTISRKYFDQALEAQVTFSRLRSFFICDINLHAGRGLVLRGEGEAADANGAFDDAAEHIAKRLRRYRRRMNAHARDMTHRKKPELAREYILREEDESAAPEAPAKHDDALSETYATVVAEAPTDINILTVRDAVMRMDLADQPVMMFRNSATGTLNVVYRRTDGHVGWIDTQSGNPG
ncbi:Ribosome-associated factor Y [Granulibacter bethesdensis]|uniref:Ribosome hibernation promoting factor n=2 Tax=Granulibacter bethesdensis TaxID=364410 RepID=A0AAC9P7Z3_9PROT|nr:Ribosome-associated factor Y [Granulibacter bethesdensis]APH61523.1 Ribosome-associated factor Y [Granulibacter bethesdensis]